jgi:hypothetical protein
MDRRATLGLGLSALALLTNDASAEKMDAAGRISTDSSEIIPLWPGLPPGGETVTAKTRIEDASPTRRNSTTAALFRLGRRSLRCTAQPVPMARRC